MTGVRLLIGVEARCPVLHSARKLSFAGKEVGIDAKSIGGSVPDDCSRALAWLRR
jgi:hypothetical protein